MGNGIVPFFRKFPLSSFQDVLGLSKSVKYWIERSRDGLIIYFRKRPNARWECAIDHVVGSKWIFQELLPGQGAYYTIERS